MHLFSHDGLADFIQAYGLIAVFAFIALESSGLPLPGEAILVTASIVAASTHDLSIVAVIACAAVAAIVGDNCGYLIGRRFGLGLLVRHGAKIGLHEPQLKLGQYLFRKRGGTIVFFGRFVAVLRAFAAVLAGANAYPWSRFIAFNAAGGLVWATLYGCGAYVFGRAIHKVAAPAGIALLTVALAAVVIAWRYLRRHEAALLVDAEAALPGPVRS